MQTYKNYRPTACDIAGLGCEDRQDWFVAPCSITRDSGPLERSNWRVLNKDFDSIDPDGTDHETHRFGHWACGWFEIILVRPDSACAKSAESWEAALSDYPIACEHDFSEEEEEEANEVWRNCYNLRERVRLCAENRVSIFAARHDYYPSTDNGSIRDRLLGH